MVRWCWVNFQCRGVLLIWIIVGQGPIALAIGAGGGCLDIFLSSITSFLSPSLWETTGYRLKYCLKGPLNPEPTNQPMVLRHLYCCEVSRSTACKCSLLQFDCLYMFFHQYFDCTNVNKSKEFNFSECIKV